MKNIKLYTRHIIEFSIIGLIALFLFANCEVAIYNHAPEDMGLLEGVIPPLPTEEEFEEYLNSGPNWESNLAQAKQKALEQVQAQDYTNLESPVTWKFLWIRCNNVEHDGTTYTLSDAQKRYFEMIAENFKQTIDETLNGNMLVENEIVDIDRIIEVEQQPHDITGSCVIVEKYDIEDYLGGIELFGKYDSMMCTSAIPIELVNAGGYKTSGVETGLCYAYLTAPSNDEINDETYNEFYNKYYNLAAIHEFIHQLEGFEDVIGIPEIPNPDESEKFNYQEDSLLEWWPFYKDILQGKVLYEGKYIGVFPRMFKFSPRNLYNRQGMPDSLPEKAEESEPASWRPEE